MYYGKGRKEKQAAEAKQTIEIAIFLSQTLFIYVYTEKWKGIITIKELLTVSKANIQSCKNSNLIKSFYNNRWGCTGKMSSIDQVGFLKLAKLKYFFQKRPEVKFKFFNSSTNT